MAADRASVVVERLLQTRCVLLDGRWRAAVVDVVPDHLPASPLSFLFPDGPSAEPGAAEAAEEARAEVSAHRGRAWMAEGQPDDDSGTLTGLAVAGLSHEDVAALAARLGATFVVQVDDDEVRVLDASGATVGCRPRDWADPWESEELDEEELVELLTEAFEEGRNVVVVGTDRWEGRLEVPSRLVWTCGDDEIEFEVDADQQSLEEYGVEESQYPGGDSGYVLVAAGSGPFLRYAIYSWSSGEFDDLGDLPDEEAARQAFWEHLGYPDGEPEREDDEDEDEDEDDDEYEDDDEDGE